MRLARSLVEISSFALVVIAACGGSVVDHGDNAGTGGNAGSSGAGGTANGGGGQAGGIAGSGGTVNTGIGGSTGVGGSFVTGAGGSIGMGGTFTAAGGSTGMGGTVVSGVGGSTGVGGSPPDLCQLPWDPGPCRGIVEAWWHDPSTGVCMPVYYSGCEGNANRFSSRAECQSVCRGGSPNIDECRLSSDCVLTAPGCCGSCEPVDDRAFVAVNAANMSKLHPPCMVACGACPPPTPGVMSTSRYFVPTCVAGECTVTDIRETALTQCQITSDCYLRAGAHCCELCGGTNIVALNRNASVTDLLCDGISPPCLACVPTIPPGYSTSCEAGRCTVQEPPCTTEHPCPL